jgi:hypothetical protein
MNHVISDLETLPGCGVESGPFKGVWDPLSLSATASLQDVRRWRESEITHGRVAMVSLLRLTALSKCMGWW